MAMARMMSRFPCVLLLILRCIVSVHSQGGGGGGDGICFGDDAREYIRCVEDNDCLCGNCDPDPTDAVPIIPITAPDDCDDVLRAYCPLVRCCSVCAESSLPWYQCTADNLSMRRLNTTCPLNCDGFPYSDVTTCDTDGPDPTTPDPTMAPVVVPQQEEPTDMPVLVAPPVNTPDEQTEPTAPTPPSPAPPTTEDTSSAALLLRLHNCVGGILVLLSVLLFGTFEL